MNTLRAVQATPETAKSDPARDAKIADLEAEVAGLRRREAEDAERAAARARSIASSTQEGLGAGRS